MFGEADTYGNDSVLVREDRSSANAMDEARAMVQPHCVSILTGAGKSECVIEAFTAGHHPGDDFWGV